MFHRLMNPVFYKKFLPKTEEEVHGWHAFEPQEDLIDNFCRLLQIIGLILALGILIYLVF